MNARPDPPVTWQRWTIDEIDEGVARVAVAHSEYGLDPDVAEAHQRGRGPERLRQAVFEAEDVPPEHIWSDEEPAFFPVATLERLLRRRSKIRGLPGRRQLREGDVFWIVAPTHPDVETVPLPAPEDLPAVAAALDVQVWDVTAAARQAAKRGYDRAVRATGGVEPATRNGR
jgi:hypothetical protein